MINWKNDEELFELIQSHLFTACVGDIMDQFKLHHQFLPPQIQPITEEMVLVGRAMPVLVEDLTEKTAFLADEKPFGLMLEALDDLKPHEIYFASGSSPTFALWGELMSTRALKLGASGAVLNGYHRDTTGILELSFPTFSYGAYAQDQGPRGTVLDFRTAIMVNQVTIETGDIIFGDRDGVCVIPKNAENDIIRASFDKVSGEQLVREAIENGMSAVAAFKKYGIM